MINFFKKLCKCLFPEKIDLDEDILQFAKQYDEFRRLEDTDEYWYSSELR